jgi:hypothetical protein
MKKRTKALLQAWLLMIPFICILLAGIGYGASKLGGTSFIWGLTIVLSAIVAVIVFIILGALFFIGIEEIKANSGECSHRWQYNHNSRKRKCPQCETYQVMSNNTENWLDKPWKEANTDENWSVDNRTFTGGGAYGPETNGM